MNTLPPGDIALMPNQQIASLVQGDMRQLIMFLAAISIISWVAVIVTMFARLLMHVAMKGRRHTRAAEKDAEAGEP